ncbi:hypothetical protein [Massilia sp. TWR1-2-2]|uniref:hypothetical protein n=1 Tax=Massilia sp. TWR1-2-2 TaxID=2804584 RepID=UPI003CF3E172
MSATRRAYAGDDNILARLERDAKRGKSGKSGSWKHATLAWCIFAGVLVLALIGTLASLARENITVPKPGKDARSDHLASSVRGGFAPLPAPSSSRRLGANAYDLPTEASLLPPMVMLKSLPAAAKMPAKGAHPTPPPLRAAVARPAKAATERLVVAAKPTPVRAAPPAVRQSPPSPPRIAAAPARPRKVTAPAAPAVEPTAVDSDVALLSAIIMHASRHSAEREKIEAARCGAGKKCPPTDAFPSLKATD